MNTNETPPGWQAQLDLEYGVRGTKTCLVNKRQKGPLTLQRSFYPEGDTCHNYILHPPGGVVGGDTLKINVLSGPGAHCLLTTPGATKFYRSNGLLTGHQSQHIRVAEGAITEWLPQQNIYFPGSRVELDTQIDVAAGGRFMGWEMHCFGRPSNGEKFSSGTVRSRTRIYLGGELRLLEHLNTDADSMLSSATGLRDMAMQGSFIAAPCDTEHRAILEGILQSGIGDNYPATYGLTLVDEVLIVRALGDQAEPMLELFTHLWSALRQHWLTKAPYLPRIWAT